MTLAENRINLLAKYPTIKSIHVGLNNAGWFIFTGINNERIVPLMYSSDTEMRVELCDEKDQALALSLDLKESDLTAITTYMFQNLFSIITQEDYDACLENPWGGEVIIYPDGTLKLADSYFEWQDLD